MKSNRPLAGPWRLLALGLGVFSTALFGNGRHTLDAGSNHVLIARADGTLWAWGANTAGQLGLGTTSAAEPTPVRVGTATDWRFVAAGGSHSLAVKTDGTLWAWGRNTDNQLGLGSSATTLNLTIPQQVGSDRDWAAIAAGPDYSLALKNNGALYFFGRNGFGQAGVSPNSVTTRTVPTRVGTATYTNIAAGAGHVLATRTGGTLWTWGSNGTGELGQGINSSNGTATPTQVGVLTGATWIDAGSGASLAIINGSLYVWGFNSNYRLGLAAVGIQNVPVALPGTADWVRAYAGAGHTLGLRGTGNTLTLWGVGNNLSGELGLPTTDAFGQFILANQTIETFTQLGSESTWSDATAGTGFTIALRGGLAFGTGANADGQLGNGTRDGSSSLDQGAFGQPDVVVSGLLFNTAGSTPPAGTDLDLTLTIANTGSGDVAANRAIPVDVRLSLDTTWDESDIVLALNGSTTSPRLILNQAIPSASSIAVRGLFRLPAFIAEGTYFVVARVNPDQTFAEGNFENNDFVTGEAQRLTFGPDPEIVFAPVIPGGSLAPGSGTFAATLSIRNSASANGGLPAGTAYTVQVYLNTVSGADSGILIREFKSTLPNNLAPGASFALLAAGGTLTVPETAPPGSYFVSARLFPVAGETGTSLVNNRIEAASRLTVAGSLTLNTVLDNATLTFTTTGALPWYGRLYTAGTNETVLNGHLASSPPIGAGQTATIETVVDGPAVVQFAWGANTSDPTNRLVFTINNGDVVPGASVAGQRLVSEAAPTSTSGSLATSATFFAPAGRNILRWTYIETVDRPGDVVYLDNIRITPRPGADLAITSLNYEAKTYPSLSEPVVISLNGINLGDAIVPTEVPAGFTVRAYLSEDRVFNPNQAPGTFGFDYVLGDLGRLVDALGNTLPAGARFAYRVEAPVPMGIPEGTYYLIVRIDPDNTITNEADVANNLFIAESRDLRVVFLPDLVATDVNYTLERSAYAADQSDGVFLRSFRPAEGRRPDKLLVSFTYANLSNGPLPVDENGAGIPIGVRVVLSGDREVGTEDYLLAEFSDLNGLAPVGTVGGTGAKRYLLVIDLPADAPVGTFQSVGVQLDAEETIAEMDDSNNVAFSPTNDILIGEVPVTEALGLVRPVLVDGQLVAVENYPTADVTSIRVRNGAGDTQRFFGQTERTFDAFAAAESSAVRGETSAIELELTLTRSVVLSYSWALEGGVDDAFNLYLGERNPSNPTEFLNPTLARSLAFPTTDVWVSRSVLLTPPSDGSRVLVLRFTTERRGVDTNVSQTALKAYLDQLVFLSPDLSVTDAVWAAGTPQAGLNQVLAPGESLTVDYSLRNSGSSNVAASQPFVVRAYLSTGNTLGSGTYFVEVDSFTYSAGLNAGTGATVRRTFTLPTQVDGVFVRPGAYFFIVQIDASDVVLETNETNNSLAKPGLSLELPDAALASTFVAPATLTPGGSVSVPVTLTNLTGRSLAGAAAAQVPLVLRLVPVGAAQQSAAATIAARTVDLTGLTTGSLTVTLNGQLSAETAQGDYFLQVLLDSGNTVPDLNRDNNALRLPATGSIVVNRLGLAAALDNPVLALPTPVTLAFTSGGDALWFGRETGAAAVNANEAASPILTPGQSSFIETIVPGPTELTFNWAISSSNPANRLSLTVNSEEVGGIAGNASQYRGQSFILPSAVNVVRWTYTQVTEGLNDRALVDNVRVVPVTKPDLVVRNVDYDGGTYSPTSDALPVILQAVNQGSQTYSGNRPVLVAGMQVSLYLSTTNILPPNEATPATGDSTIPTGAYFLGNLDRFAALDADDRFGYIGQLRIPATTTRFGLNGSYTLPGGNYFLIAVLDSNPAPTGVVDEWNETNNFFVSDAADIEVELLPELEFSNITASTRLQATPYGRPEENPLLLLGDKIDVAFRVVNTGQTDIAYIPGTTTPVVFSLQLRSSPDDLDSVEIARLAEPGSFPVGIERTFRYTVEVDDSFPKGRFYYFAVVADFDRTVAELDETNNTVTTGNADIFGAEVALAEALDLNLTELPTDIRSLRLVNSQTPFFGQRGVTNDGVDAAQSSGFVNSEAQFEIEVEVERALALNFRWRLDTTFEDLSHEFSVFYGSNRDNLTLIRSLDNIVGGNTSTGWVPVSVPIEPGGVRIIRIVHERGFSNFLSAAGYVDTMSFESPDLAVSLATANATVSPGAVVPYTAVITNQGQRSIQGNEPFSVEIWLARQPQVVDTDNPSLGLVADLRLDAFTLSQPLAPGASLAPIERNVTLPLNIRSGGQYYLLARVDSANAIAESNETNNTSPIAAPQLTVNLVDLTVSLAEGGLPTAPVTAGTSFNAPATIRNLGPGTMPSTLTDVSIDYYLSTDAVLDRASDIQVVQRAQVPVTGLVAGGSVVYAPSTGLLLPTSAPVGTYFLIAEVDAPVAGSDIFKEQSETNNSYISTGTITITGVTVAEALDFTLSPSAPLPPLTMIGRPWFGQTLVSQVGNDAAQSPPIANGTSSSFQVVVSGPAEVRFLWQIDSGSLNNTLRFSADGFTPPVTGTLRGQTGEWREFVYVVSQPLNTLRWTYTQTEGQSTDRAYVDNLRITAITEPDLVVDTVTYTAGDYVAGVDSISVSLLGRNQGAGADLLALAEAAAQNPGSPQFRIVAALSNDPVFDAGDYILGGLDRFRSLDSDNRFGYAGVFPVAPIDGILEPGAYYLLVTVDVDNAVAEYSEANNTFSSATADVVIVERPDLEIVPGSVTYRVPSATLLDPIILAGSQLEIDFTLRNVGRAAVALDESGNPLPVALRVVLDAGREFGAEAYGLIEISETKGLPAGQSRTYRLTVDVEEDVPVGIFQYLAVIADSDNAVVESDEGNNIEASGTNDLIFALVGLDRAIDIVPDTGTTSATLFNPEIRNSFTAPFYGQKSESFDGRDAARSSPVANGEEGFFELQLNGITQPTVVSFRWRANTENTVQDGGGVKRDYGSFSVNGVEVATIAGEEDWRLEAVLLPAGNSVLRWSFIKDATISVEDEGIYVDNVTYDSPDLTVAALTYQAGTYTPGQTFGYSLTIRNEGLTAVPAQTPFVVRLLLSETPTFAAGSFVVLDTFSILQGVQPSAGGTNDVLVQRSLVMPNTLARSGQYYLAARVDATDVIPEADEADNTRISQAADVGIDLQGQSLEDALDYSNPLLTTTWRTGGDGVWFPQRNRQLSDGTFTTQVGTAAGDAVQGPSLAQGQTAFLEFDVEGPQELTFYWKTDQVQNVDYLALFVDGVEQRRISGLNDWSATPERVFIAAGPRTVRWQLVRQSASPTVENTAWLDEITLNPVTTPELAISRLNVTGGEYVLDVDEITGGGTTRFPSQLRLTVEGENLGQPLPAAVGGISASDMEVRLSTDAVHGNGDDLILGRFAQVDGSLDSRQKIRFLGPIFLTDDLPEGDYYVIAVFNPLQRVPEYTLENNIAITGSPLVKITRLPNLRLYTADFPSNYPRSFIFDENKLYFPLSEVRPRLEIYNDGLDVIPGSASWSVNLRIKAIRRTALLGVVDTAIGLNRLPTYTEIDGASIGAGLDLGSFNEREFIPGRSDDPGCEFGGRVNIFAPLYLPNAAAIQNYLGPTESISDFVFYFIANVDTNNQIDESDESQNRRLIIDLANLVQAYSDTDTGNAARFDGIFEIRPGLAEFDSATSPSGAVDFAGFQTAYSYQTIVGGVPVVNTPGGAGADDDGDGLSNFLEYAFNRNPLVADGAVGNIGNTYTTVTVDGEEYLAISFDFVYRSRDLRYVVEAFDGTTWSPVLTLFPWSDVGGYSRFGVGARTLNNDGGLVFQPNVIRVVEAGLSARMLVRDTVPISGATSRLMRVRVENR